MGVRRIVCDLESKAPAELAAFYRDLLGLETAMDMGWIVTLASAETSTPVQLSMASHGGSGAPVPHLSVEVDDLDDAFSRARSMKADIAYGPVAEPWGVQRFFVRDPDGRLLNILSHSDQEDA